MSRVYRIRDTSLHFQKNLYALFDSVNLPTLTYCNNIFSKELSIDSPKMQER